jgi:hypothetical protein
MVSVAFPFHFCFSDIVDVECLVVVAVAYFALLPCNWLGYSKLMCDDAWCDQRFLRHWFLFSTILIETEIPFVMMFITGSQGIDLFVFRNNSPTQNTGWIALTEWYKIMYTCLIWWLWVLLIVVFKLVIS